MKKYILIMIFFISVFMGLRFTNNYHSEIKVVDDNGQCWPEPTCGKDCKNRWLGCCSDGTRKEMFSEATTGLTSCPWGHEVNLKECCSSCDPTVEETKACYTATINGVKVYKWGNYDGVPGYTKVENTPQGQCNSLIIKKVDSQNKNKLLSGASITILKGATRFYTGEFGQHTFEKLSPGVYHIMENEAPSGYVKNETIIILSVSIDGTISVSGYSMEPDNNLTLSIKNTSLSACYYNSSTGEYDWTDSPKTGYTKLENTPQEQCNRLIIKKVDENGVVKSGATVTITGPNNYNETKTIGNATLEKLSPGTYKIKETVAPTGYILDQTEITVTVSSTGTITVSNASNLYDRSTTATINAQRQEE